VRAAAGEAGTLTRPGLAVVITSPQYPGITVLLGRLLGERLRPMQRAGLLHAAVGVLLVTGSG
jgi:drug/metabolite transporter (DMT)-like permease